MRPAGVRIFRRPEREPKVNEQKVPVARAYIYVPRMGYYLIAPRSISFNLPSLYANALYALLRGCSRARWQHDPKGNCIILYSAEAFFSSHIASLARAHARMIHPTLLHKQQARSIHGAS